MPPICNENGVYAPDEVLRLDRPVKGWLGLPTAEIELAFLGRYWIWATGFQLMQGDHWGSFSPLHDDEGPHARRAPTREAALAAASASLRERLAGRRDRSADAARILDWLDALRPAQMELAL